MIQRMSVRTVLRRAGLVAIGMLGLSQCMGYPARAAAPAADSPAAQAAERPFAIEVLDDQTGRGVPLVELRTTNRVRYVTDSNGLVAFAEPGLMHEKVWFHVKSHGYEYPVDGFGCRGATLQIAPGGQATLKIHRINLAQRLYRVVGEGIYRDSLLLGRPAPLRQPLLCGEVFGSDTVINAIYRGKLYWFWGDTNYPNYPLGNFHVPAATSELPGRGGLDPRRGVDLTYFCDRRGRAAPVATMNTDGPTWVVAAAALPDESGAERLMASYVKIRPPMINYGRGLMEFDDASARFKSLGDVPMDAPLFPSGHALRHRAGGVDYVYFGNPFPLMRVRATRAAWQDPAGYEGFSCLRAGARDADGPLDRAENGTLHYAWKPNTLPLDGPAQQHLVRQRRLRPEEAIIQLRDRDSGAHVAMKGGSVAWNAYRRRFVMIATQHQGTSNLGEVWYAEADAPMGPWAYAVKVVTHDDYSFYNPKQDAMFDADGGRTIFFEGTYSASFSGARELTPRYDYTQIMYLLDLGDPRLALPVPIYRLGEGSAAPLGDRSRPGSQHGARAIAFFALDRATEGTVPVYEVASRDGGFRLGLGAASAGGAGPPLFYALPPDKKKAPVTTCTLYEFVAADGRRAYATDRNWKSPGFARPGSAFCTVWQSPVPAGLGDE